MIQDGSLSKRWGASADVFDQTLLGSGLEQHHRYLFVPYKWNLGPMHVECEAEVTCVALYATRQGMLMGIVSLIFNSHPVFTLYCVLSGRSAPP